MEKPSRPSHSASGKLKPKRTTYVPAMTCTGERPLLHPFAHRRPPVLLLSYCHHIARYSRTTRLPAPPNGTSSARSGARRRLGAKAPSASRGLHERGRTVVEFVRPGRP